jgi:hypothetical protein
LCHERARARRLGFLDRLENTRRVLPDEAAAAALESGIGDSSCSVGASPDTTTAPATRQSMVNEITRLSLPG